MGIRDWFSDAVVRRALSHPETLEAVTASRGWVPPLASREARVIGETSALLSVDFMACIMAKSQPMAALPVHVFQRDSSGHGSKVEHPLARLLSARWNDFTTAFEGMSWLILQRDVFGNTRVRVEYDRAGSPAAIWPLSRSCEVEPVRDPETGRCFWRVARGDDMTHAGVYSNAEIITFKTPVSKDGGITGQSLAQIAAEEVGLSVDLERFYARLLDNGNHFPGYLETEADLTNPEKLEVVTSLREQSGVSGAGSIRIFDKGLKYRQNPLTIADMSMIDMQTWVLQQCCRVLRVPPAMVYENSRATYSNVESMQLQFAQTTLANEARSIEQALQPVLDAMSARYPRCYVKFDLNGYMRGDYAKRMEGYRNGVYAGYYTRAEVREWEELPPIDGLDEPLLPTAYYELRDGEPVTGDE